MAPKKIELNYRRRLSYNTKSNKTKLIRTPGGVLRRLNIKKLGHIPKCGDCGCTLPGLPKLRSAEYKRIAKHHRTVSREYGGNRCGKCVKERIIRSFLLEEKKLVKQIAAKRTEAEAGV